MAEKKIGVGTVIIVLLGIGWLGSQCSKDDKAEKAGAKSSTPTTTTTRAPLDNEVMRGDGYHQMGGIDGKDWGVWVSTGSPQPCTWSIRVTDPYGPATILREGTAEPGQPARVAINPPGDISSISGEVKATGGRVVFQTSGCGSWAAE